MALLDFAKPVINVAFNSCAGFGISRALRQHQAKDVAIILAIDSTLRIIVQKSFAAMLIDTQKRGSWGSFSWMAITLLIQPTSVYLAQRIFNAQAPDPLSLFGYIAAGWKANMMVKDLTFIGFPALKPL